MSDSSIHHTVVSIEIKNVSIETKKIPIGTKKVSIGIDTISTGRWGVKVDDNARSLGNYLLNPRPSCISSFTTNFSGSFLHASGKGKRERAWNSLFPFLSVPVSLLKVASWQLPAVIDHSSASALNAAGVEELVGVDLVGENGLYRTVVM